jgi:hypothetical protein
MATCFSHRGRWLPVLAVVALAVAVGCSGQPWVNPPVDEIDRTWYNAQPTPDTYPDPHATLVSGLETAFVQNQPPPAASGRPLEVLVLSGGGKYGAYTAGLLVGWTENGTRPQFDVVTGISSGALTAIYAFLGPKYDSRMAMRYNTLSRTDLFRPRPVRGLITGTGLFTSEPMADLIEREVNDETIADIRQAHCEGRRFFVATGSLTTLRPVIWDIGAIATSGRPDANQIVRKILLASSSIPGMVPPVEFDVEVNGRRYRELHGDAGNVIQGFIRTANGLPPGSNVYVLAAGKVYRDPHEERPRIAKMVGATVSNSLYAIFRDDMIKLHALCMVTGSKFRLVALPRDFKISPGSMSFTTEELQRLYTVGYQMSVNGIPWRTTPPGSQPGETLMPRTGLEFVAP